MCSTYLSCTRIYIQRAFLVHYRISQITAAAAAAAARKEVKLSHQYHLHRVCTSLKLPSRRHPHTSIAAAAACCLQSGYRGIMSAFFLLLLHFYRILLLHVLTTQLEASRVQISKKPCLAIGRTHVYVLSA